MPFSLKKWFNLPAKTTPISAAALEDLETRLSAYTDELSALKSSPGFAPSVIFLDSTPEFYGAVGDGVTDDTVAFQKLSEALSALGGGTARLSAKTYVVDGLVWESKIKWLGRGPSTILKAKAGSSNAAQIIMRGRIAKGEWKDLQFATNGNAGQDCFRLTAEYDEGMVTTLEVEVAAGGKELTVATLGSIAAGRYIAVDTAASREVIKVKETTGTGPFKIVLENNVSFSHSASASVNLIATAGGCTECVFENVEIGNGNVGGAWQGNCIWFRGGAVGNLWPHQFIDFRNVSLWHENTGTYANTSRGLKMTGQCEKVSFDPACYIQGRTATRSLPGTLYKGTNVELSREFLQVTTIETEAAVGAIEVSVASTAGIVAGRFVSIGEGATNEIFEVKEIVGKKVVLKTGSTTAFAHLVGENVYRLTNEGSAASKWSPAMVVFSSGSIQNADLQILTDAARIVDFFGVDFENSNRVLRRRESSLSVNLHDCRILEAASEGTANGTGTVTVGSATVSSVSTNWVNGDLISGPGIPSGTTVSSGGGTSEITLSAAVTANGTEGAVTSVPLNRFSKGLGYIVSSETESAGSDSYYISGGVDNGVQNKNAGARLVTVLRGSSLLTQISSGVSLSLTAAKTLAIRTAREVVVTNASTTITALSGFHGTGETVTVRATVAGLTFESGGNLYIPAGKLILEAGDFATFARTDYSGLTWALVNVQRAAEVANTVAPIVLPLSAGGRLTAAGTAAIGTAFKAICQRAIVPATGKVRDVSVWNGGVVNGNNRAAIFDCGEASKGNYTVLWEGSEVVMSGTNGWQSLGSPELSVVAGKQIMVAIMNNGTTATFGTTVGLLNAAAGELPASYLPVAGGAAPKVNAFRQYSELKYANMTEAQCEKGGATLLVIGRVL